MLPPAAPVVFAGWDIVLAGLCRRGLTLPRPGLYRRGLTLPRPDMLRCSLGGAAPSGRTSCAAEFFSTDHGDVGPVILFVVL